MRTVAAALLSCLPLLAQFSEFVVTDDGRITFVSPLSLDSGALRGRIYRITSDGLALVKSLDSDDFFGPSAGQPLTSGDGSVTGYAISYPCRSGSCGLAGVPRTFYYLEGTTLSSPLTYDSLQVTRNGRYLFGRTFDSRPHRIDLWTMRTEGLPPFNVPAAPAQAISNSGLSLLLAADRPNFTGMLHVWAPAGDVRVVPGTEGVGLAIISPDGSLLAYERTTNERYELVLTDLDGRFHRLLASVPAGLEVPWPAVRFRFHPSFANDGTLLFLEPDAESGVSQATIVVQGSAEPQRLLTIEEGVQSCALSGNAELAWVHTYSGQLLRVRTVDRVADEMIPPTPFVTTGSPFAFPGSVFRLDGSGLTPGTRVTLDGTRLPFAEFKPQQAAVQLPWEFVPGQRVQALVVQGESSPFREVLNFSVLDQPTFTFERGGFANAFQVAHEDFRGLVSPQDPALPGETIDVFARNMGPVQPAVATGEPAPASPPARITTPFACYLYEFDAVQPPPRVQGLRVPFAGLAGGSVGIYQIDVTIPEDWPSPVAYLQCRMEHRGDSEKIYIAPAPRQRVGSLRVSYFTRW